MNHRVARWVFALGVGIIAAWYAYQWATSPVSRAEREQEEAAVIASRAALRAQLAPALDAGSLEIVDPLASDRAVGKTYVYRATGGWEVSGYYRRGPGDLWHPYLMRLDSNRSLTFFRVQDAALRDVLAESEIVEVLP